MDERHKWFLKRLRGSKFPVVRIAAYLTDHGKACLIPPTGYALYYADAKDFSDSGDLFIVRPELIELIERVRVEVKGLGYDFTGPEDWPHGNRFFVCKAKAWDSAKTKPAVFFYLNPAGTHFARIFSSSSPSWWRESIKEHETKIVQETLISTLDNVSFFTLED